MSGESNRGGCWPHNVGISAIEIYFPYLFVDQSKLEVFDGVSAGKYTIGLGQDKMGFCSDCEDINSLSLTVLSNLLEKNNIDAKDVGRLEVGTETIIDKSKSVKTVLMQLFENSGNSDIEGVDTTNACFGGTSALFNAVNWVESSSWDGRVAVVVIADIAVYAAGNARPTGGAGAIAMVVSPNAPLVFDRGMRSFHMAHVYDFYKPNMASEYPVIDGQLSVKCFLSALDACYKGYCGKMSKQTTSNEVVSIESFDYFISHTPYCKMVRKAVGRCILNDYLNSTCSSREACEALAGYKDITLGSTFDNPQLFKEVERTSVAVSTNVYQDKCDPSILLAKNIGNMYTPSLYSCLVSLLINVSSEKLTGKQVVMFSYGSGLASCMFSMSMCPTPDLDKKFQQILDSLKDVKDRLSRRKEIEASEFVKIIEQREKIMDAKEYVPRYSSDNLFTGTYYLTHIDSNLRRYYKRKTTQNNSDVNSYQT